MKNQIVYCTGIISMLLFLSSCAKKAPEGKNCLLPARNETLTLELSGNPQNLEVTSYQRDETEDPYSVASMPHDSIAKLYRAVSSKTPNRPILAIFLIMTNADDKISKENLDKIVYYCYQKQQYTVEAFSYAENRLSPDPRIRFLTNKVRSNTAYFLKEELKQLGSNQKLRVLQILASDITEFPIDTAKVDQFDTNWLKRIPVTTTKP